MNTQSEGVKSFLAGAALAVNRRVKLDTSGNTVIYAGAGEKGIGVTQQAAESGAPVAVKLWNSGGTFAVETAGAVVALAAVYGAADGKVDDVVLGPKIGEANEAAGTAADIIEIVVTDPIITQSHVADASQTQDALTDNTGGVAGTTLAVAAAATSHTITDSSTGTASTSAIAEITGSANAGSADLAPVENAIATLAAELALTKADLATARTEGAARTASLAAQLAKVKTDVGALVTKLNSALLTLEKIGAHAAS